ARSEMPVPDDTAAAPPDPATLGATQVIAAQQDQEPVEAAASAGQQRAFEGMTAYQQSTKTNTTAMAAFGAPVQVIGGGEANRHHGGGVQVTTPALNVGVNVPLPAAPPGQGTTPSYTGGRDGKGGWDGGWGGPAIREVDEVRGPR